MKKSEVFKLAITSTIDSDLDTEVMLSVPEVLFDELCAAKWCEERENAAP